MMTLTILVHDGHEGVIERDIALVETFGEGDAIVEQLRADGMEIYDVTMNTK